MKVTLNRSFKGFSGAMDGFVYRTVNDEVIVSGHPTPTTRAPSARQLAQRERFRNAQEYAQEVLADPCQREWYEQFAQERKRRADKIVASDYLNPPEVRRIDLSAYHGRPGDIVRVLAFDDVQVVAVDVSIEQADGTVLEQGAAACVHGVWQYAATRAAAGGPLRIVATAQDRPGNRTVGTASYPIV